jgi:hypothetical protein
MEFAGLSTTCGGIKARIGDLFSDPVSRDSTLILPLISVTLPGFPVSGDEAEELPRKVTQIGVG